METQHKKGITMASRGKGRGRRDKIKEKHNHQPKAKVRRRSVTKDLTEAGDAKKWFKSFQERKRKNEKMYADECKTEQLRKKP